MKKQTIYNYIIVSLMAIILIFIYTLFIFAPETLEQKQERIKRVANNECGELQGWQQQDCYKFYGIEE